MRAHEFITEGRKKRPEITLRHRNHLKAQVRPVETGQYLPRLPEVELLADVLAHLGGGGSGEGADRGPSEAGDHLTEAPVVWSEIVTPLADTVRFIDGDAIWRPALDELHEALTAEALGRHQ